MRSSSAQASISDCHARSFASAAVAASVTELVPDPIRVRLLANGADAGETDHVPVVKFFNPVGPATWIVTEMMPDGDTLFGLCDLGFGYAELGTVSLHRP